MRHSNALALPGLLLCAVAAADNASSYSIPPQPLANALDAAAQQGNLQLLYAEANLHGKTSPPLHGKLTARQAMEQLLAGSGLAYTFTADNAVSIKPAAKPSAAAPKPKPAAEPESAATLLPPVKVTATLPQDDPQAYSVSRASSATKTDTPIMETPVSIQVVPKAVIEDQMAVRVGDALRNVSGYFDSRGEEFFYDTAYLRGFATGSRQYIDGLLDLSQSHSLANVERIEVVKGPAAALYGRLEPGGLINYVSKRPLDTPYYSIQQQFGSFGRFRTLADATGPLTEDGSISYRVNVEYLASHSFVDVVRKERGFVAAALSFKLAPRTQLDVDFRYHNVNGPTSFGLPAIGNRPANIPISRFMGEAGTDDAEYSLLYGGLSLSHEFSDAWRLDAKVGYNHNRQYFTGTFIDGLDETSGDASRFYSMYDFSQDSAQGIINLTGKFNTFGMEHTLAMGGDLYQTNQRNATSLFLCDGCGTSFPAPINIYQPIIYGRPGINLAGETYDPSSGGRDDWWGLYLQDQVKIFEQWHLLFGSRYDQARTSYDDTPTTNDGEFSPRVGLLYRPVQWLSVYGNYVKAFNAANSARVVPGVRRTPEHSEGYEVGFKGDWDDGRLTANLAFYELTRQNIAQPHPDPALAALGFNVFVGEGRSRGIEFDVSGKLTDSWSLIGTYSYTDTEVTRDLTGIQGKQFFNVPEHAGSLWTKYDFSNLGYLGFWSGAGVYWVGQRQGDSANSYQLPGYGRLDMAMGYSFKLGPSKLSLQFNIDNLLDKTYYTASTWGARAYGIQPGIPRTFIGSLRVEF